MPDMATMQIMMLEMGIGGGMGGMGSDRRRQKALAMSSAYNFILFTITEPCLSYHFLFNCNQHRYPWVSHMLLYTIFERHELMCANVLLDILNMACNASSIRSTLHQLARVT